MPSTIPINSETANLRFRLFRHSFSTASQSTIWDTCASSFAIRSPFEIGEESDSKGIWLLMVQRYLQGAYEQEVLTIKSRRCSPRALQPLSHTLHSNLAPIFLLHIKVCDFARRDSLRVRADSRRLVDESMVQLNLSDKNSLPFGPLDSTNWEKRGLDSFEICN